MGYASHLNQHVKLRQNTKFQIYVLHSLKDMEEDPKRTGYRYPSLKIVFGGIFEVGSASHLNQHVKLCTCTKFHACIIKCTIRPLFEVKRLHYLSLHNLLCNIDIQPLNHVLLQEMAHQ